MTAEGSAAGIVWFHLPGWTPRRVCPELAGEWLVLLRSRGDRRLAGDRGRPAGQRLPHVPAWTTGIHVHLTLLDTGDALGMSACSTDHVPALLHLSWRCECSLAPCRFSRVRRVITMNDLTLALQSIEVNGAQLEVLTRLGRTLDARLLEHRSVLPRNVMEGWGRRIIQALQTQGASTCLEEVLLAPCH